MSTNKNKNTNTNNNTEPRYVCVAWEKKDRGRKYIARKVVTERTMNAADIAECANVDEETIFDIFKAIKKCMRKGYMVTIEDTINFAPVVDKAGRQMEITALTVGSFRQGISDLPFTVQNREAKEVDLVSMIDETSKTNAALKDSLVGAVPYRVVDCPHCNKPIRITGYGDNMVVTKNN